MAATKAWHVEILIFEDEVETHADAVLTTSAGTTIRTRGTARRNPHDPNVPEIGDELATARALSALGHRLLDAAAEDIGSLEHHRVQLEG